MNYGIIIYILGYALKIEAGLMILPAIVGFIYKEKAAFAFLWGVALAFAVGTAMSYKKPKNQTFYAREAYVSVPATWVLLSVFGALPFVISGDIPNFIDAFFEMVSGFTTTGSTILTDVEAASYRTNFWRCFSHWIGGMGILVFILTVLPITGGSTMNLMKAESPGPQVSKIVPKVRETSKILYVLYAGLTAAEIIFLLVEGAPLYDALAISFGTAGTGGFGIKNDSIGGYSVAIQYTVAVFMILFGVNFSVYYLMAKKQFKQAMKNEESHWYFTIIALSVLMLTVNSRNFFERLEPAFRGAFFHVASIITTTGFAVGDYNDFPQLSKSILVLLMFIGACAGSTGGGLKVSRIAIMLKNIKVEIEKTIHPRTVMNVHMDSKPVEKPVISSIHGYLLGYIAVYILSMLIISLDDFDFLTTFSAVAATINNIGPGFNVVGPTGNFSSFSYLSKLVFAFDMIAGRLEILPVLVMLYPKTWRKKNISKK